MQTFRPILFTAALAGLIVGIVVTLAQQFGTVPLILNAEIYEKAAEQAAGPAGAPASGAEAAHSHDAAAPHSHGGDAWEPADGIERNAYTALFNIVEWVGFGLMLTGILVLLRRPIDWREGFLWGLAGFVVFSLAPGLGLPPELPGIPTAPLGPRQLWWIATVTSTGLGLWLIAFKRSPLAALGAIALIAAPHLVGAPELATLETNVPEALSHHFVVAVTLTTLLSWALLGGLVGYLYRYFALAEGETVAQPA